MSFKRDKKLLDQWVRYYKFKRYLKSSKVIVKEALISGLYLAAKKNGCSEAQFLSSRSVTEELLTILRAEVLLRARFFSGGGNKQTLSKKVRESANLFITSIGKQYSERVYW